MVHCASAVLFIVALLTTPALAQGPILEGPEPNSYPSFTALACGQQGDGIIGAANDVDYWRVQCSGPMTLRAFVGPGATVPRIADTILELRDAGNTLLVSNDDGAGIGLYSEVRDFRVPAAGIYFLAVRGYAAYTGSYSLDVSCGPTGPAWTAVSESAEPNQTNGMSIAASCTNRFQGAIGFAGDIDRYSIAVGSGQVMTIGSGPGDTGSAISDTILTLRNAAGTVLVSNDDALGLYARVTYTFPTAGTYYVDIAGYLNQVVGTYTLEFDCSGIQPSAASMTMFDTGCLSSFGQIPRFQRRSSSSGLTYVERPLIGTTCVADLALCPPNSAVFVAVGFQSTPPQPIPGAPGCNLLVAPLLTELRFSNATGAATWVLGVPHNQAFVGLTLECQGLVFDPPANALGAAVSNRLRAVIGNSF